MPRPRSLTSGGRPPLRVAVIVSRYNASITDKLLEGARNTFQVQCPRGKLDVIQAPGSFELPALALAAAQSGLYQGVAALGCLIKGETSHDRVIADAVAHGLVQATIATGVPITFGVLTVDTPEQAQARAGGDRGNKGADAMTALLETIAAIERMNDQTAQETRKLVLAVKPDKAARKHRSSR
jgi:6,7-dimethyl-8-ribityllumazine synthase